jgi:2-polyprenyl-3-methyl-5-hydroxy-6-metoxy-1,4-benzoquinol methylase
VILADRDRDNNPLRTVACSQCGLVWTDPRPTDEEVATYYKEQYRLSYKGVFTPQNKHVLRAGRNAMRRYAAIDSYIPGNAVMLDIGSGGGEFLYLLKSRGFNVSGIEPNRGYAEFAAETYGLDIRNTMIQEVSIDDASRDFITMFHVLEHTEDPLGTLQQLNRWVKSGGHIFIEVPNVMSNWHSPKGQFHLAHLYNFSVYTLKALAEKAGFEVLLCEEIDDGENLHILAKKPVTARNETSPVNRDNFETVRLHRARYTPVRYMLSRYPWQRFGKKLTGSMEEKKWIKPFRDAREILDSLYKNTSSGG